MERMTRRSGMVDHEAASGAAGRFPELYSGEASLL
jgi:hypothetical protein